MTKKYTVELSLTKRHSENFPHHKESVKLVEALESVQDAIHENTNNDCLSWDEMERNELLMLLDIHFEQKAADKKAKPSLRDQIKEIMKNDKEHPIVFVSVRSGGTTEDGYFEDASVDVSDGYTASQTKFANFKTDEEVLKHIESNRWNFKDGTNPGYWQELEKLLEKKLKLRNESYQETYTLVYWLDGNEDLHAYVSKGWYDGKEYPYNY